MILLGRKNSVLCLIPVFALLWFGLSVLFGSCGSGPEAPAETPLPSVPAAVETPVEARPSGQMSVSEEIRSLVEHGSPFSVEASLDLIRHRELGNTEFGRIMNAVNIALLKIVYPALTVNLPSNDPPQTHLYSRILRDVERGSYRAAPLNSEDYLERVLPFLALYTETREERLLPALADLQKAEELNPKSVLAPLFLGMISERGGRPDEAEAYYSKAWDLSRGAGASDTAPDCYPAALGLSRIMETRGEGGAAAEFLSELVIDFPDNFAVKRQLAMVYYRNGDWARAENAIAEILQKDSRDGEFILYRAHVLVEQGQFLQAQAPLDLYAAINPQNRLYLFLRARVQAEGYRNRKAALNYLRSLMRSSGTLIDDEASVYAARLLMESPRAEDQREGRELLAQLLALASPSHTVLALALQDCIRRESWAEARPYMTALLAERRSSQDLMDAYTVEHGLGNNAAALSYAREFYERNRSNDEGLSTYISALVDSGRGEEAARMIESRLPGMTGGLLKSRFFYLRSRTRSNDDLSMSDLRSSLFEDPRNLAALTAMFEIYHRRRDERRALYYLKQALALAPESPQLKRYAEEYSL